MPRTLPPDVARGLLARGQRLAGAPQSSVVDMVRAVGGLAGAGRGGGARWGSARGGRGARWPRSTAARFEERSVARTWVMRGTLHLIPAEDARWMVALLGPIGLQKSARRIAELGVGDVRRDVRAALADGPLTRRELADAVRARGVSLPDHPQVPAWLTGVAALQGEIIEGPDKRVRADRRLARAGRARRRMTPWSSSRAATPTRTRRRRPRTSRSGRAWGCARRAGPTSRSSSRRSRCSAAAAWVPRGLEPAPPHVRLLPMFDSYLLGHRDRSLIVRAGARQGGAAGRRDPRRDAGRRRAASRARGSSSAGGRRSPRSGTSTTPTRSRTSCGSGPRSADVGERAVLVGVGLLASCRCAP